MNIIPAHCVETRSDSRIVFSENKSKITFENPARNTYRAIQVDGCVFTAADGSKCDNLLESEEYADQYFVELKGGDSGKAVEQLCRHASVEQKEWPLLYFQKLVPRTTPSGKPLKRVLRAGE